MVWMEWRATYSSTPVRRDNVSTVLVRRISQRAPVRIYCEPVPGTVAFRKHLVQYT